jgi:hypothetical protein
LIPTITVNCGERWSGACIGRSTCTWPSRIPGLNIIRLRIERRIFWPFRFPMDDNAPDTQCTGVLGRIMLDDTLKTVVFGGILAIIAKK